MRYLILLAESHPLPEVCIEWKHRIYAAADSDVEAIAAAMRFAAEVTALAIVVCREDLEGRSWEVFYMAFLYHPALKMIGGNVAFAFAGIHDELTVANDHLQNERIPGESKIVGPDGQRLRRSPLPRRHTGKGHP